MAISDLQLALIGVGAAGVGGVWAYNKWQERKLRQLAERILHGGGTPDVLADPSTAEVAAGSSAAAATDDRIEPVERVEPVLPAAADAAPIPGGEPDSPWADPLADGIARLEFAEPVPAPALWAAQAEWAGHLGKPLYWVAQAGSEWRLLTAHDAGRYPVFITALQLADRRGAVTEGELTLFADGVHHLAAQLAGVATLPDARRTACPCPRARRILRVGGRPAQHQHRRPWRRGLCRHQAARPGRSRRHAA